MKKRKYQQTRRAEQALETRRQIVEAAMTLHEQLGPARTSVKAIAELAGVERLTVYRHFPDDASLFEACTSHWLGLHPPPALTEWAEIDDAPARSHHALLAFYRYYRKTQGMLRVAYRDVDQVEALQGPMARIESYIDQVRDDLLAAWEPARTSKKVLSVTLRHGLRFSTWQSLAQEKMKDRQIADLLLQWLRSTQE